MFAKQCRLPFADAPDRSVIVCSNLPSIDCNHPVIFCADGGVVRELAQQTLAAVPNLTFVGVTTRPQFRSGEYVIGRDARAFARHERFFTETVPAWCREHLGLPLDRERMAVCGFSHGGAFAVAMGLRHPGLFGRVIALSVAGRPVEDFAHPAPRLDTTFALAVGTREGGGMRSYMKRLAKWLRDGGASTDYRTVPGGHTMTTWSMALADITADWYAPPSRQ